MTPNAPAPDSPAGPDHAELIHLLTLIAISSDGARRLLVLADENHRHSQTPKVQVVSAAALNGMAPVPADVRAQAAHQAGQMMIAAQGEVNRLFAFVQRLAAECNPASHQPTEPGSRLRLADDGPDSASPK
jgi:hypothetical protein